MRSCMDCQHRMNNCNEWGEHPECTRYLEKVTTAHEAPRRGGRYKDDVHGGKYNASQTERRSGNSLPCNGCIHSLNCKRGHSVVAGTTCPDYAPRKNAKSGNAPGRSKPEYREYTSDQSIPRPVMPSGPSKPRPRKWIKQGQYLYYKNKLTGAVERGQVTRILKHTFVFAFDDRQVTLPNQAVGTRLFRTWDEARLKGKINKS